MRLIDADKLIYMSIGDDKPFRFVPTEFIEDAETIEAIPVDFIEDWFDQRYRRTEHEQLVYEMIRDWNEIKRE